MLVIGIAPSDVSHFDAAQTVIVQGFKSDHDAIAARGYQVSVTIPDQADAAVVTVPRSRAEARARIAAAAAALPAGAALWIDGQKTDGIDSVLKEMKALLPVDEVHSRGHGKLFRVTMPEGDWLPADWAAADHDVEGFVTRPGVFSADGVDPASRMLAAALPDKMPTRVVDLGAGWGWLAAQVLAKPGVDVLHLVEADHTALDCARRNISDARAVFHWADATQFRLPEPVNGVVMNPPFHSGRTADPQIGARFIRAAAGLLTGAGKLWMVANRHLPYEAALAENFAEFEEIAGDNRFKVIAATGAGKVRGAKPRRR